jgi:hypothetical protein
MGEIKMELIEGLEIFIFDLDNTTIDSRHRQGAGSLESWHRNTTRDSIFNDDLLPLSQYIRLLHNLRYKVIICTSRCLTKDDYEYLYSVVDVPYEVKIISRDKTDSRECGEFKKARLSYLANFKQFRKQPKILIDDNDSVRDSFRSLGNNCIALTPQSAMGFLSGV